MRTHRPTLVIESKGARSTQRRGFAMIDVIVGGVMLGVGLAVIISLAARSMRTQTDGEKQLVASWIADEFLNLAVVEGPVNFRKIYDMHGRCLPPFDEYGYEINIEDLGLGEPMRVTATIHWNDGARSIQVQTLLADRGSEPNEARAPYDPVDRINRWYEIYEKQQ